jgi:hypothetical protein
MGNSGRLDTRKGKTMERGARGVPNENEGERVRTMRRRFMNQLMTIAIAPALCAAALDCDKDRAGGGGAERAGRVPVAGVTLTCEGFELQKRAMREAGFDQETIDKELGKKMGMLSLRVGERWPLAAVVDPPDASDKRVKWKSSNRLVAWVFNGTVVGVGHGYATITATTADGGMSDTCEVGINRDIFD